MRRQLRNVIDRLTGFGGVRVVNNSWGPRGHTASLAGLLRQGFKIGIVWDVGASNGCWSVEISELLPTARFHLFEPNPTHADELRRLCGAKENFTFHHCGLADADAVRELTLHGGQSSLLCSLQWQAETASIDLRRADSVVESGAAPAPDFIKVDIQGSELAFLEGARSVLQSCSFLLIEVSWLRMYEDAPYAEEVLAVSSRNGFHVYDICTYSQRRRDGRLAQSDLLLAHTRTGLFDEIGW
jgi:FkbM family methyltransferase